MAKKFKFKLDGLLKVRRFKEEQLKVELGAINQEIQQVKNRISQLNKEIEDSYTEQEKIFESDTSGQLAKFFPYYIDAKREDIKANENLLYSLSKRYEKKLKEVGEAMGETKLLNKMRDKEKDSWKKSNEKKEFSEIEEVLSMRKAYKDGEL
ncbi:MAG: flagellar export protein FliJ [Halobacteriovoraceae bacterium]|nr:flagellar export protein FliJ [Halobacteriovoraceae bacterium]|tara:strand:+ start:184812 stop:185267 length:456 start_codon:yes stop_codon:yes gene_type:complete